MNLIRLVWLAFIVIVMVNAVGGKNKKGQKTKETPIPPMTAKPITAPATAKTVQEQREMMAKQEKAPAPRVEIRPANTAPQPIAPRVHTHLSLDCDMDDPSGSMDFISTEGVDPCHDDALPSRAASRPSFPALQEQPGLSLEWNGDALVRSVIMQEVLTRPCQRQRR